MATSDHRSRTRSTRFYIPSRLRAETSSGESIRIERVISVARLFLAVIAIFALVLDPVVPGAYAPIATGMLVLFAGHSVAAALVLRMRQRSTPAFALTTHTADVLAAAVTLPMAGPNNPFLVFFLFVLASAAFRWGFRETVATTAAGLALTLSQHRLAEYASTLGFGFGLGEDADTNRLIVRCAYLVMMGLLLGYLAEQGRSLRAETAAAVHLLSKVRVDVNITRVLTIVAKETVKLFDASQLLLVVEELESQRVFRWDTLGGWSVASAKVKGESTAVERPAYFFGSGDHGMAIARRRRFWISRVSYRTTALDPAGRFVDAARVVVPEAFVAAYPFRRLILAPVRLGDEWSGRIFIFEPRLNRRLSELTEFLQMLIRQVGPAVLGAYLQNRLQARAGALERARVASELHDGVIQSLIGVEMQLEVLRGREALQDTPEGVELRRVQDIVHDEVLNLRDLMQQMRPAEFDPDALLDHFADMVQRFGRDVGISARFVTSLKEVALEPSVCFELGRIVQEGLANIRKHSAATQVVVRFGVIDGAWRLEIGDDGRGFPFEGRLSMAELDARGLGPVMIKERVRTIGGQLTVDSTPGRGSRLEVLVPQEGRE